MWDRIFRSSKDTNLIVGFYPDERQACEELLLLRKKRIFRSVCISASEDGRRCLQDHACIVWPLLAVAALLPAIAVLLNGNSWYLAALMAAGVFGLAILLRSRLGLALPRRILLEYTERILPGEAMLLIQCSPGDTRRLNDLLQENETASLFVIRPYLSMALDEERPSRKLLSTEQLRQHAISCADSHGAGASSRTGRSIFGFLKRWERIIETVRHDLADAVELDQSITPSAEWLLDNAYIIQNHSHDIRASRIARWSRRFGPLAPGSVRHCPLEALLTDGHLSIGCLGAGWMKPRRANGGPPDPQRAQEGAEKDDGLSDAD